MLGPDHIRSLLRDALRNLHLGDADIYLTATTQALTRFANNRIHQNVYHDDAVAHIRVAYQKRQGRAVTNNLSSDGLRAAVLQAREHAGLMPEDSDFPGLPKGPQAASVDAYDEATANAGPEHRAAIVGTVCRKAADARLEAAGFYRTGVTELAVLSTRGRSLLLPRRHFRGPAHHRAQRRLGRLVKGWRIGAWAKSMPRRWLTRPSARRVRGRNPQDLEPGDYPVVLEHYAVDDMMEALSFYGMGAHMVQDGRSWMSDVQGQPAMSPLVSIWDDGLDPAGWPVPFDAEGVPRSRVEIVADGVVQGPVYNSYTAAKVGLVSTGHQRGATGGPTATNLFMRPGIRSTEQLIASVDKGLYITRFYYTRLAHNRGCVMTGMTRDGTFLIENGELTTPVKNLRFTQSYVDALAGCQALSDTAHLNLNEAGVAMHVPAALLESWRFTGQTV